MNKKITTFMQFFALGFFAVMLIALVSFDLEALPFSDANSSRYPGGSPLNGSVLGSSSVSFSVAVFADAQNLTSNLSKVELWFSDTESLLLNQTISSGVDNGTTQNFTALNLVDGRYYFNFLVHDNSSTSEFNWTHNETVGNATFDVDTTAPEINLNMTNNFWFNHQGVNSIAGNANLTISLNITVIDNHLSVCNFHITNVTEQTGYPSFDVVNISTTGVVNNTMYAFNMSGMIGNNNESNGLSLKWGVFCNDTVGNSAWSNNITFGIDDVPPTAPNMLAPENLTGVSYLPVINWSNSTEGNFNNYSLHIDNNSDFSSLEHIIAITTQSADPVSHALTSVNVLDGDQTYYLMVNVSDLSGNVNSSSILREFGLGNDTMTYSTDSTCHTLFDGWNLCGVVRPNNGTIINSLTAEEIQVETNADFIARFNGTHQFQTYTNGTSINNKMLFERGDVIFIFVSGAKTWGTQNRVWDSNSTVLTPVVNLTNVTTGWNVISIMNRSGVQWIDVNISLDNGTWADIDALAAFSSDTSGIIVFSSYYNNTGTSAFNSRYVPFIHGFGFNDNVTMDFAEAFWLFLPGNESTGRFNSSTMGHDSAAWNRTARGRII